MTGWLAQVPGTLLAAVVIGGVLAVALTALLAWHAARRVFDIPRVPKPPAMYVALGGSWAALVAGFAAGLATIVLLRDYRRVDRPTELAEVRCAPAGHNRVQMELRPGPLAPTERYDVEGDTCVVWVNQVELRPGLGALGVRALSRVEGVGTFARPAVNPTWLTPRAPQGRVMNLLVRRAERVPLAVPASAGSRVVLVSSPGGPAIQQG